MGRWIVFDQPAADAVRSQCGVYAEIRRGAEHMPNLVALAEESQSAVAVAPGCTPGKLLVMRFHRSASSKAAEQKSSQLAPAGFLGLSDSIDMDSEPEQPKKWWQKIIG